MLNNGLNRKFLCISLFNYLLIYSNPVPFVSCSAFYEDDEVVIVQPSPPLTPLGVLTVSGTATGAAAAPFPAAAAAPFPAAGGGAAVTAAPIVGNGNSTGINQGI